MRRGLRSGAGGPASAWAGGSGKQTFLTAGVADVESGAPFRPNKRMDYKLAVCALLG